jgi:hypothetical protein
MYPSTNRSGLYHDGYYHPKPAALHQSTLSQILQYDANPNVLSQRLQAHADGRSKAQQAHTDSYAQSKYFQERQNEARMHAEAKYQFEKQVYQQQLQKRQAFEKRGIELRNDPSALFRHYNEYMTHFPVPRGDRANPYHLGLLANQEIPDDRESERAVAITYAKAHWENAWDDKRDYKFVVNLIREENEKKKKKEREKFEAKKRANV